MGLVSELRRRNVLRVAAAYVVVTWLVVQVAETVFPIYGLSDASIRIVITVLAIGLPNGASTPIGIRFSSSSSEAAVPTGGRSRTSAERAGRAVPSADHGAGPDPRASPRCVPTQTWSS